MFLELVLTKFVSYGYFRNAIIFLCTKTSAIVNSSDFFSRPFIFSNSTRQERPISPLIFVLCIELLAEIIRASPKVKGLWTGGENRKVAYIRIMLY